jgi:transposase-like protein
MTKATQTRMVNWRLKVLRHASEVTQNVARTCRHFGISRQTFYKWERGRGVIEQTCREGGELAQRPVGGGAASPGNRA